jgi:hypothetical protein
MKPIAKSAANAASVALALPTGPKTAVFSFYELVSLFYGRPGIGKTTVGASFPDAVLFSCERVSPAIRAADFNAEAGGVKDWTIFREGVKLLEKSKGRFKTVVIDTVEAAYRHCFRYVCAERGVEHPPEKDYGRVWNAIKAEFAEQMDRIARTGRGIVFTAHAKEVEITSHSGEKYTRIQPSLSGQAFDYVKARTDCVFYLEYLKGQDGSTLRVAITEGDEIVEAKHAGELPRFIPLVHPNGAELFSRAYRGEPVGLRLDQIRTTKQTSGGGAQLVEGEKIKAARKGQANGAKVPVKK